MSFRSRRSLHRTALLLTGIVGACTLQVPKEGDVFSEASRGGKSSVGGSGSGGEGDPEGGTTSGGSSTMVSGGSAGSSGTSPAGGAGSPNGGASPQAGAPGNGGNANGGAAATGGVTNNGGAADVGGSAGAVATGGVGVAGVAGAGDTAGAAGVNGTGGAPPDPFAAGLVAHFKFDEVSGNAAINSIDASKPGTLMGGAARTTGRLGRAVSIRNDKVTTDYVDLPAGLLSGLSETTISMWVQNRSIDRKEGRAFDFGTGTGNHIFLSPHGINPASGVVGAQVAGEMGGLTFVNIWSDFNYAEIIPPATTPPWRLFTVTWNAAAIRLYADGVLVATKEAPTALPSDVGPSPNWLGKTYEDFKPIMYAHFDDLRIYNRVLPDAQILGLFQVL